MASMPNLPLAQEFDPATARWLDLALLPQGASHVSVVGNVPFRAPLSSTESSVGPPLG